MFDHALITSGVILYWGARQPKVRKPFSQAGQGRHVGNRVADLEGQVASGNAHDPLGIESLLLGRNDVIVADKISRTRSIPRSQTC